MESRQLLISLALLIGRWAHIVAAAVLVGGTLFYELVVPVAIDDLKDEQKLWIFARARWAFRWIVWICSAVIILSGISSTYRNWNVYNGIEGGLVALGDAAPTTENSNFHVEGAGFWWLAHTIGGIAAVGIALALVKGPTPPRYPLAWMRVNLTLLLLVIFLASTARHVRLRYLESRYQPHPPMQMD